MELNVLELLLFGAPWRDWLSATLEPGVLLRDSWAPTWLSARTRIRQKALADSAFDVRSGRT